jgi:hypothetical protein
MARRTQLQSKTDDLAFPVRVKVKVPARGFGQRIGEMTGWMNRVIGADRCARHSAAAIHSQACAFYFCDLEAAGAFFAEFSELELADGTKGRT